MESRGSGERADYAAERAHRAQNLSWRHRETMDAKQTRVGRVSTTGEAMNEGPLESHAQTPLAKLVGASFDAMHVEIARLKTELEQTCGNLGAALRFGDDMKAERDALKAALREYGFHKAWCTGFPNITQAERKPCDCGFSAALNRTADQPAVQQVYPVPSGWRGQAPWFNVGDEVLPKPDMNGYSRPVHIITEITERGFKYKHERFPINPYSWTEGGETFEPSSYERVAVQQSEGREKP